MAVSVQNAVWSTSAPVAAGSGTLAFGGTSQQELSYIGTVTFTGDGANTFSTLNFIDGTNALPFTPVSCFAARIGGNAASSIVVYANVINNIAANVIYSAAPATNATMQLAFFVMRY